MATYNRGQVVTSSAIHDNLTLSAGQVHAFLTAPVSPNFTKVSGIISLASFTNNVALIIGSFVASNPNAVTYSVLTYFNFLNSDNHSLKQSALTSNLTLTPNSSIPFLQNKVIKVSPTAGVVFCFTDFVLTPGTTIYTWTAENSTTVRSNLTTEIISQS
jgi:hypothetical protein